MAESADVLKEYLISIGVKADEGALQKFAGIIGNVEKMMTTLTGAIAAGITAIETLVTITTSELDDLYWATKRLKSSAGDIQDFELRMRKAGRSAQDARAALETISAFRRTNPAGDSFLGILGVNSRGKGDVDVMDALIKRFKQLNAQGQYWLAVRYGERLGLDERMVWSMVQTSAKAEHVYNDMYKRLGINQDKATKDAHEYQNQLRDLQAEFTVISQTIGLKFLPVARQVLEWLMTSPDAKAMGTSILNITSAIADMSTGIAKMINALPPEAREWGLIGWLLFGKKIAVIMGAFGWVKSLIGDLAGDTVTDKTTAPDNVKKAGEDQSGAVRRMRWMYDHGLGVFNSRQFNTAYAEYLNKNPDQAITSNDHKDSTAPFGDPKTGKYPLGVRSNNPGNLMPGGKEATYKTPEEGMTAMGHNLLRYGRMGLTTVAEIVRKWAPPGTNDTEAYVKRVTKETGFGPNQQLNLSDPIVLRKLMTAMVRVEQGYMPYTPEMIRNAAHAALGKGPALAGANAPNGSPGPSTPSAAPLGAGSRSTSVTINQKNTTTIHGAKDPDATAKKVEKVNTRTNGDLVRNMATAVI